MSDIDTIRRTLRLLKQPGEKVELRCDQSEGNRKVRYSGYYDDHERLARDAEDFGGNCFITVHRLNPEIPATNELNRCKKGGCTKAKDIFRRTLLYTDFDPVRPVDTPATDEQHQAAIEHVKYVAGQLPFSRPLLGSSGNGACGFWAIDLAPDSTLPKRILKTIQQKWETPKVKIDLTVASVARIARLLGTNNYKGGKAGRQATILEAPETLEVIPESTLEAFAPAPKQQSEDSRVQQLVTSWAFGKTAEQQVANVKVLLNTKGVVSAYSRSPDSRGTICDWFHFDCVFRPGHNDAKNWIKVHPTEGVSGGCFHAKCHGKGLADLLAVIAPELSAQTAESFDDSHRLARSYTATRPPLVIWQDAPHGYQDGVYREEPVASVKAALNLHVKKEFDSLGLDTTPNVTTKLIGNAYAALEALTYDREESTPHWRKTGQLPAAEFLQFQNGLLHVPSYLKGSPGYFTDPTPDYFTLAKLPYSFQENAPEPKRFIDYCLYQWTDANVHLLLEEILGDILMSDPRRRVFYVWTGKGGAGKSALVEAAVEGLVGEANRCAVNLKDFAVDFGLEAAIGKKLLLVAEAGVDARHAGAIVENIKRITGNDPLSIKRKFRTPLTVRLDTKILAVSNHLLNLLDDSGALFDRLIPLNFVRKIENPDMNFPLKLKAELPGIVLLALKGWKRLQESGFTLPESSKQLLAEQPAIPAEATY